MAPLSSRTGLVGTIPKRRRQLSWTNRRYGRNLGSLIRTKLEKSIKWMEAFRFSSSKESAIYTMYCQGDVHCGVWRSSDHSPTFPSLHLHHNSFSNPSVALPTSQFILQPFRCFTYVTAHSPTLLSLLLRHRLFIYRAAHGMMLFCLILFIF